MSDSMSIGQPDVGRIGDGFSDTEFVFDFDEAVAPKGLDPIPNGVYDVVITDATVADTSSGGKMVKVTYQVEGGDFDNRLVFDQWVMPNRATQEPQKFKESLGFLQQKIEAVTNQPVTGSFKLNPMDLPGCRLKIQVSTEPEKPNPNGGMYPAKNRVNKYISTAGKTFDHKAQNGDQAPAPVGALPQNSEQPQSASTFRL